MVMANKFVALLAGNGPLGQVHADDAVVLVAVWVLNLAIHNLL